MTKNIKVALTAVNSRSSHSNPALFYIKQILKENKEISTSMLELTINDNLRHGLTVLTEELFDYYLFSIYIWNSVYLQELIPLLKKIRPDAQIVVGGPEVTYNLKKWQSFPEIDCLVCGQAEDYARNILQNKKRVYQSRHTPINQVPFPYAPEDYPSLVNRLVYYEASRGCVFNCSYCLSSCEKQKLEYRSLDTVLLEMKKLISIKPKIVKMVDRTFNSKKMFARRIWSFLIEEKSSVPFHFELHPLFLEEEDFLILEKAPDGLFHFEVGIQSTNKEILESVNRPWNWEREKENISRLCSLKNIHTHLDQIVGLPGDTVETAKTSFNEIISFKPEEFQLGFLKILPGTALSKSTEIYTMTAGSKPPYEVFQTSTMSFEEMTVFYRIEADLNRFYNSGNFSNTITFCLDNCDTPWKFFSALAQYSPENFQSKQWAVLAESLLKCCNTLFPGKAEYIKDLLRLDWCPIATGQNFPPVLRNKDDENIKDKRRDLYKTFEELIPVFARRDYNRSILYISRSNEMKEKTGKMVLFYRRESGTIERYSI